MCRHRYRCAISIHAPHARSDIICIAVTYFFLGFQSTLLMRGATSRRTSGFSRRLGISIHAPHARSDVFGGGAGGSATISIHAPHARSDADGQSSRSRPGNFNPRSSCEERLEIITHSFLSFLFQSTLLMRGATPSAMAIASSICKFQSTLLMRGATRYATGDDFMYCPFQSTLLMRGATHVHVEDFVDRSISIHAPHARSDLILSPPLTVIVSISIHAPHARSDVSR